MSMIKTEGKYIILGKHIIKKRDIFLGVLGFLIIIVLAAFLFLNYYKSAKEQEKIDIREGKMITLGGQLIEINKERNSFMIDTDPHGTHKKYMIFVENDTKFDGFVYKAPEVTPKIVGGFPVFNEGLPKLLEPEKRSVTFSELVIGMKIEVRFGERLDIDDASKLVAKSVLVIEQVR